MPVINLEGIMPVLIVDILIKTIYSKKTKRAYLALPMCMRENVAQMLAFGTCIHGQPPYEGTRQGTVPPLVTFSCSF